MIAKKLREILLNQSLKEIEFDRKHRNKRLSFWYRNENLYYGKKTERKPDENRSNILLPRMHGFVDTLLSKVDNAPRIQYVKGEEADLEKANRLNALIEKDGSAQAGNWAFKDILGKKQSILYGRAIFEYHASSDPKYKSHFTNVDVYDFLIDPSAGGVDIENANHIGRTGIFKDEKMLKDGAKKGAYLQREVAKLLSEGSDENVDDSESQKEKQNRYIALSVGTKRHIPDGTYKFWEWYTTHEGQRYYLLLSEDKKICIRCEKIEDLFATGMYPFVSFAPYPDLSEFWTPAPADMVAEIFMGQSVLVNQHFDNNEFINRPTFAYDSGAIKNPALLKYRRDGRIPFKKGSDIRSSFNVIKPDAIQNNERMYQLLDDIANLDSGVNAAARGQADEDKVGIFEGNLANISDRLGLINKSYANMYQRLAKLYINGVREHMNTRVAITMIGNDGIDFKEVTKADLVPKKREFDVSVVSSDAEIQSDVIDKKNKITFLEGYKGNQDVNQQVLFEEGARIAGFDDSDIKRMLDTDEYGESKILSEAAADFQTLITTTKPLEPNERADNAYKQKMVNLLEDKSKYLTEEQENRIIAYIESISDIVIRNTVRRIRLLESKQGIVEEIEGAAEQTELAQEQSPNPIEQPQEAQSLQELPTNQ